MMKATKMDSTLATLNSTPDPPANTTPRHGGVFCYTTRAARLIPESTLRLTCCRILSTGDVKRRWHDMVDQQSINAGLRELALFAGAGGGILGGHLLGWRTVCAVEFDPYAASVLAARQNDGILPPFPIWDDVCTFDGKPWRGLVDVVSGGFPCQDISVAGSGAGLDGERSGLWAEMARIIDEVRPRFVFVENSPALTSRGLGRVLGDLAEMGFDAEWGVLGADDVGAPHRRKRIWIVAHAAGEQPYRSRAWAEQDGRTEPANGSGSGREVAHANGLRELQPQGCEQDERRRPCNGCGFPFDHELLGKYGCPNCEGEDVADSYGDLSEGLEPWAQPGGNGQPAGLFGGASEFPGWPDDPAEASQPRVGRVADGVAARVDRIKALGNGQVPRVAAAAFALLSERQ